MVIRTLYLAGPDVFRPDAAAFGAQMRQLCAAYGFLGLFPFDPGVALTAPEIYRTNLDLIRRSDAVVANLNPFRGVEPDSGTSFEVGYAVALGKPVFGYVEQDETLLALVIRNHPATNCNGVWFDHEGRVIEDFSLPCNLMLSVPVRLVVGGLEQCLSEIKAKSSEPVPFPTT